MMPRQFLSMTLVFAFAFLALTCVGPRPEASVESVVPDGKAGYVVTTVVTNGGKGEGTITLRVRLLSVQGGDTYQAVRELHLRPHERTRIQTKITAPTGNYRAEVDAVYPPQ